MHSRSRRSFLIRSTSGLSSVWIVSNWPGILAAAAHAQQAAGQRVTFDFFTQEQAADIDAMASQIIPTDDSPGAHEAGCVYFIDRGLTTFLRSSYCARLIGSVLLGLTPFLESCSSSYTRLTAGSGVVKPLWPRAGPL